MVVMALKCKLFLAGVLEMCCPVFANRPLGKALISHVIGVGFFLMRACLVAFTLKGPQ